MAHWLDNIRSLFTRKPTTLKSIQEAYHTAQQNFNAINSEYETARKQTNALYPKYNEALTAEKNARIQYNYSRSFGSNARTYDFAFEEEPTGTRAAQMQNARKNFATLGQSLKDARKARYDAQKPLNESIKKELKLKFSPKRLYAKLKLTIAERKFKAVTAKQSKDKNPEIQQARVALRAKETSMHLSKTTARVDHPAHDARQSLSTSSRSNRGSMAAARNVGRSAQEQNGGRGGRS